MKCLLFLILFLFAGVVNASTFDDYRNAPYLFVRFNDLEFYYLNTWRCELWQENPACTEDCFITSNSFPLFGGIPQTIMCYRLPDLNPPSTTVAWERELDWDVYYTSKTTANEQLIGTGIKVQIKLYPMMVNWWRMSVSCRTLYGAPAIYFTGEVDIIIDVNIYPQMIPILDFNINNQELCYCEQSEISDGWPICNPVWSAAIFGYANVFMGGNFSWPLFCQLADGWDKQIVNLEDVAAFCDMWLLEEE